MLNFTSTNEDSETEIAALAGASRILCLTGTGTRALDLLLTDALEVIALDANPAQDALLALKIAAIEAMEQADCLAFLGIAPATDRLERYRMLRDRLDPVARDYWDGQSRLVADGIWHAGQWERLLRWNARFLAVFHRRAIAQLFAAASPAAQGEVWRRHFTAGGLRRVEAAVRDLVWRVAMREPAAAYLPSAREVSRRIEDDFARASRTFLFAQSDIATLALLGRHSADGPLPAHLRAENYDLVRQRLPRLRRVSGDLVDLGALPIEKCDGFSLSDFGSYCGPEAYAACWQGILRTAVPGARFCERLFMNEMPPPAPRVAIDRDASERLSAADRSIIYRVRVGTIA